MVKYLYFCDLNFWAPLSTSFMVKTIFFENLFNNMLRHTSLIACLAGHGRQACPASRGRRVSQIATAIFLPRPDAKALGDSVQPCLACILLNFYSFRGK